MTRAALEHLLRAAAALTNESEFVVIGSQAILGQFPDAPEALRFSIEADLYPRHAPDKSDLIDGAIGELSQFHQTFGYYAHGVDQTTAALPAGWEDRLMAVRNQHTGGATGWCLEVHDLACAKLVAGRHPRTTRRTDGERSHDRRSTRPDACRTESDGRCAPASAAN
jgi:hypothetical protein